MRGAKTNPHGLGRGGEPVHAWVERDHKVDREVLREIAEASGAVVMGRRLFDSRQPGNRS